MYVCIAQVLKVVSNFQDMQLSEDLLRGIYGYGFEKVCAIYIYMYMHMYTHVCINIYIYV